MIINFKEEDHEIYRGVAELDAIARADIEEAHGPNVMRPTVSARTTELYSKIVDAVEIDRDANSN